MLGSQIAPLVETGGTVVPVQTQTSSQVPLAFCAKQTVYLQLFDYTVYGLCEANDILLYQCDRVKPCHACCAHGYPSKCVYESVPDEEARPISQAEEIRNLRDEIKDLRNRINDRQDGTYKAPSPTKSPDFLSSVDA